MNNESTTEKMIQDQGATAPRLTPAKIDAVIAKKEFHRLTDVLTVCVLTLVNGFTVTGESACASPENYRQEIGEKVAFENAREKIWVLEGYLLKQKLYEDQHFGNPALVGQQAPMFQEEGPAAPPPNPPGSLGSGLMEGDGQPA